MKDEEIWLRGDEQHGGSNHPEELPSAEPEQQSRLARGNRAMSDKQRLSSFRHLPSKVIEHILYLVDANTFASLALLNRKWRCISESAPLYAYHLSRCPSFSRTQGVISSQVGLDDLYFLKRRFFGEISRNTFDVFLRPRKTLIKLTSTSLSSSTAFPRGEAFRFNFSANGQMILCISSSRIVVLDVASGSAVVRHELKTWRRPLDAAILDDGSLIAIVSSRHQVNIYTLSNDEARHIQGLALNDVPRTLALSPTGSVLAIAYDDMIEVYAVGEQAHATQRRAVRCSGVDSLSFSSEGDMLFGSSADGRNSRIVTITAPFYTEPEGDASPNDIQIGMWTTQILFPDIIRGYSHACLLPLHTEEAGNWILGYDEQMLVFRAIRANNANMGTTYFVTPLSSGYLEPPPTIMPTADSKGELVAMGYENCGLWIYGVPDRLDLAPATSHTMEADGTSLMCQREDGENLNATLRDNSLRLQQTIVQPKVLIHGHKMSDMSGITAARWVRPTDIMLDHEYRHRRLVAVAPGGVNLPTIGDEDVPVDGGRVLLLDFERSTQDGETVEINIEIGEAEPKMLGEPNSSMDTEVELERRRTRVHRGNTAFQRARAASRESYPAASLSRHKPRRSSFSTSSPRHNEFDTGGTLSFLDAPYDNTQPRSRDTLQRAATAAATLRRQRNPPPRPAANRIGFGARIPHESDADNWVPPPPPYTREPEAPLPDYLRRTLLPSTVAPAQGATESSSPVSPVRRAQTTRLTNRAQDSPARSQSTLQRLNTTSTRLVSRMRRNTRESELHDLSLFQNSDIFRGRGTSSGHSPNVDNSVPESFGIQPQPRRPATPTPETTVQSHPRLPTPPVLPQTVQFQGNNDQQVPDLPLTGPNLSSPLSPLGETMHWPSPVSPPQNGAPRMTHHAFSVSSPNILHVPDPEFIRETSHDSPRTGMQRPDRRSQSQDIRQPLTMGRLSHAHRVSTAPTMSSTPSDEQWRRRIEEWNERTIHERNRKSRRCIVM